MPSSLETLSENLERIREKKGLSQMELANKCDFSISYINKIESGDRSPSLEKLDKIAEVLDTPTYKLLKP